MARSPISSEALPDIGQPSHAPSPLDQKDREIILELEQDSRRSLGQIARRIRLSKQTLHYRIERLVRQGIITSFVTVIDASKLGFMNHEVWIQLGMLDPKRKKALIDFLVRHPNVRWVATCGGKFDIVIGILAESIAHFNSILKSIQLRFLGDMKNHSTNISSERFSFPRSYLTVGRADDPERKASHLGGEAKKAMMDEEDLAILGALSKDSRAEISGLARKAGVTPNTVRAKMKRLREEGVIQGYTIFTAPGKMGVQNYDILINIQDMSAGAEKELERYCLSKNNVTSLLKAVGKWDIDIAFDVKDNLEFQEFIFEFRTLFANMIKEYEYVPILHVHKLDHFPMADGFGARIRL